MAEEQSIFTTNSHSLGGITELTSDNNELHTFCAHPHVPRLFELHMTDITATTIESYAHGIYKRVNEMIQVVTDGALLNQSNIKTFNKLIIHRTIIITDTLESIVMTVNLGRPKYSTITQQQHNKKKKNNH
jgi:hypothetical protein